MNLGACILLKIFSNHGCDNASFAVGRKFGSLEKHFFKKSKRAGDVFQNLEGE